MSLRRSPQLTPASLAARRSNALRSTGPRSAAGKARSCLNALRHGRRARDLRAKIVRTGDSEAVFLLDWFHHHILSFWRPRTERTWRYTVRLAARAWCFMNGFGLRPRAVESQQEAERKRACPTYRYGRYGDAPGCSDRPQHLQIAYKRGPGIRFLNPTPTRRKHALLGWLPEFRHIPGPPPKTKRVRRVGAESEESYRTALGLESLQQFSPRLAGELPPRVEGEAKNLVQTKLECGAESIACPDFRNRLSEISIVACGGGLQGVFEGPDSNGKSPDRQRLDGRAPPVPPCDIEFAEEEPWTLMDPDDDDSEVLEASHALIELQWSKWRQATDNPARS